MDPELLLNAAITALRQAPPEGLDLADVNGFFRRNRDWLLELVRRALALPMLEPAFTRLHEEHRLIRLLLDTIERAASASTTASVLRVLGDLVERIDQHVAFEDEALFPFLRARLPHLAPALDHATAEHAEQHQGLSDLVADLRAGRAPDRDVIAALRHHLAEEEAQIVAPALSAGLTQTPSGRPGGLRLHADDLAQLAERLEDTAEPTRWGGRRGRALQPGEIDQNTRVVTAQGEHGLVTEVHAIVISSLFGGRRDEDVHYSYNLKLDSGRTASARGQLFEELAWPTSVVPDIQIGDRWVAPAELWSQVVGRHRDIGTYAEKADNARKPEMKRQWSRHSASARKEFLELFRLLAAWRWEHPGEPIEGLDERRWRLLSLEARESLTEDERWELAWLKRVPAEWATRFKVGDRVVVHILGPHGRQPEPGWTVAEIRGHEAILSRGERGDVVRAEPLWMLKADDSVPLVETFTEPRYLRDLAADMLVQTDHFKPYPNRGAVSRAVKTFLAENGIQVSTRVGQGSMVTGIDLYPANGSWSPAEVARLRELLPGLNVWSSSSASYEPWETTGDKDTYQGDYTGKSAGLAIPAEHIPRFAAILAAAMKADGQQLNALGERRLAAGTPSRTPTPTSNRGGATADQRAQAAEGCRDLDFDLPGYGHIRVVCGEQGRRDVWNNIFHGPTRYGYNGGRWARNQRPPEPVLAAIRERGVTAFGA